MNTEMGLQHPVAFLQSFGLVLAMISALGPQNLHVLTTGLRGRHVGATVALCVGADALMVVCALSGVARALEDMGAVATAMRWIAAAWLLAWSVRAARTACGSQGVDLRCGSAQGLRGAVLAAAWVSFGNPSAYVETLLVVGGVGSVWQGAARWSFGVGALAASACWFTLLAYGARVVGPLLCRPLAWRMLHAASAAVMLVLAWQLVLPGAASGMGG